MKTFRVQARVAACVDAIVLLVQVSQAQAQTYSFVFQFGSYGSGDGQFAGPAMVAVDAAGNIYVADRVLDKTTEQLNEDEVKDLVTARRRARSVI